MGETPPGDSFWQSDRFRQLVIWVTAAAAAVVVLLIAVLVVIGRDEDGTASASPTPELSASPLASASASPTTTPTVDPTPVVTPTPMPTATPAPATPEPPPSGPPADLARGWARVETPLNLREEAAIGASAIDRLAVGEVVWVSSESQHRDGYNWYAVQTLAGDEGWIATGSVEKPYATMVTDEETLVSCGTVESEDGIHVAGLRPGPIDPALRGAFVLVDATGTEACVTYALEDGETVRYIQLFLDACGAPQWDGERLTLKPTSYGDVINDYKVKSTVEVADALLAELSAVDDQGMTNKLKTFLLGGQLAKPFACMSVYIEEEQPRREIDVWLGGECLILTELTDSEATVKPASGGSGVTFLRTSPRDFGITVDQRTIVNLFATTTDSEGERLWMGGFGRC